MSTPAQLGTNCWVARYGDANDAAATPAGNDPARPERGSLHPERLPLEGQRRRDLRLRPDFDGALPRTTSNAVDDRARYPGIHRSKWTGWVLGPWKTPSTWEKTHRQKGGGRNGHQMAVTSDTAGYSMVEGDGGCSS